jgi:hypothetical protein
VTFLLKSAFTSRTFFFVYGKFIQSRKSGIFSLNRHENRFRASISAFYSRFSLCAREMFSCFHFDCRKHRQESQQSIKGIIHNKLNSISKYLLHIFFSPVRTNFPNRRAFEAIILNCSEAGLVVVNQTRIAYSTANV